MTEFEFDPNKSRVIARTNDSGESMKRSSGKKKMRKRISAEEFDARFDRGEDITPYLDLKNATFVQRVNVDFPAWMVQLLDREATKLNVSRQAIIKMWIRERLDPARRLTL